MSHCMGRAVLLAAGLSVGVAAAQDSTPENAALQKRLDEQQQQIQALQHRIEAAKAAATTPADASAIPGRAATVAPATDNEPRVTQSATNKFAVQSADGAYSIGLTGLVQGDTGGYLRFKADSPAAGIQKLSSGFNARRARIGITGTAYGDWAYRFIYDAGNSQDTTPGGIETAQITYTGFKGIAIDLPGYSSTPFTLEQATSSADLPFIERSTPSNIAIVFNAGDSRSNTGVRVYGDRYWFGAFLTGPASGDAHTLVQERFGAFQRATVQVLSGTDYSLHLGVGIDELIRAPNTGPGTAYAIALSDRPELRIDPTALLNTGNIGSVKNPVSSGRVYGVESAGGWHGLFAQSEYFHYQVSRRGLSTDDFDGGYGAVGWTITGENRAYNRLTGSYGSILPRHPFSSRPGGGWGAWEVLARVSYTDLTDNFISGTALTAQPDAVNGGRQVSYTAGLNWYPNTLLRFVFNYVHTEVHKLNDTAVPGAPLGVAVGTRTDGIALRAQVSY
jgi:phosphate-selective porin OprO/OprP